MYARIYIITCVTEKRNMNGNKIVVVGVADICVSKSSLRRIRPIFN